MKQTQKAASLRSLQSFLTRPIIEGAVFLKTDVKPTPKNTELSDAFKLVTSAVEPCN